MELLGTIINELASMNIPLAQPLLKTKIFASRIGNEGLADWVSNELNGYKSGTNVPDYRVCYGHLDGTFVNGNQIHRNRPLPSFDLDDELRVFVFDQAIEALEHILSEDKQGVFEIPLTAEYGAYIQRKMQEAGNPFFALHSARKYTSTLIASEIISAVREKLLGMLLKVEEEFGHHANIEDLKKGNELITKQIMNITGDGNIINTGNKAKIEANININKGSISDLARLFEDNLVPTEDIATITELVQNEEPDQENKRFGEKVNGWITQMIGKSLDGSWQIATGAAGSLLADAIKAYYGM